MVQALLLMPTNKLGKAARFEGYSDRLLLYRKQNQLETRLEFALAILDSSCWAGPD